MNRPYFSHSDISQISRKCECASPWWIAKSPSGAFGVAWPSMSDLMGF